MSEAKTEIAPERRRALAQRSFVLPQWVLEALRPPTRLLSKLLWRMSFRGTEHIPLTGGLVIAANHQTYIDPIWISIPIKRPLRYLAWDEAFDWPIVGPLMTLFGAWPLQIEGRDPAAIRRALQWIRAGGAVVIFPEGGRGYPDGSLKRFKPGAVRMALEAEVPILPVTIRGGHRVWPVGQLLPRFSSVEIIYHEPYRIAPHAGEDVRACVRRETERLSSLIAAALR
ncbi:MAG: 1-acyl-sn-glycerol-3-phosphate acyltransferase [Pyrinomonas methylaliphatogenes]|nr:1-acyl-sn-glycerol-3-phosphate acyltransferase [Pyrinomonas methylaliphatogenes]